MDSAGAHLRAVTSDRGQPRYSVNFAVVSRHAEAMSIVLARYNPDKPGTRLERVLEIALDPECMRSGDVWHLEVGGLRDLETLCYGWRAQGDSLWQGPSRFAPGQFMCFPPFVFYFFPLAVVLPAMSVLHRLSCLCCSVC